MPSEARMQFAGAPGVHSTCSHNAVDKNEHSNDSIWVKPNDVLTK